MVSLIAAIALAPQSQVKFTQDWEWSYNRGSALSLAKDPDQSYLYVAQNEEGVAVLRTESRPLGNRLVTRIPTSQLARMDATTVLQDRDLLYVALGNFFKPGGSKYGLAIVDVANPEIPRVLSLWVSADKGKGASGLALNGTTLAVGAMSLGVALFDVADARQPRQISTIRPDPNFPVRNPREPRIPNARGLAFNGENLIVAYDAGGLRILDCSHPESPRELGRYAQAAMIKKQQAYNSSLLRFPYAFLAVDYAGFEVVDISNPSDIKPVSWWNPWHAERPLSIWFNSEGHTNQMGFDSAGNVILSAGDSDVIALDLRDPRRPKQVGSFGRLKDDRGTWAMTVQADTAYVSWVRSVVPFRSTWGGVRALRIERR